MPKPDAQAITDDAYWDEHWDRYAEATRLNPGQRYRRKLICQMLGFSATILTASHIRASNSNATILDAGCGAGDLLEVIAAEFPKAQLGGIDQSASGLSVTQKLLPNAQLQKVNLVDASVDPGALENWASHMVCSEVLEHIESPVPVLKNLYKFLKPGGALIVTVPGGPKSAFDKSIGHFRHYTQDRLRQDLEAAGYTVELATGSGFPVFNLYRLVILMRGEKLNQDIDGKPSLLARFVMAVFRGFIGCSLFKSPWGWQIVAIARKENA